MNPLLDERFMRYLIKSKINDWIVDINKEGKRFLREKDRLEEFKAWYLRHHRGMFAEKKQNDIEWVVSYLDWVKEYGE